jgi:hypothetical protein
VIINQKRRKCPFKKKKEREKLEEKSEKAFAQPYTNTRMGRAP